MEPITIIIIVLVLLLLVSLLFLLGRTEGDPLTDRINEYASRDELYTIEEIELSLTFRDRVLVPIVRRISEAVTKLAPQKALENTARQLELAGVRKRSPGEFWALRLGAMLLFAFLMFSLMNNPNTERGQQLLYMLLFAAFGFQFPQMMLLSMIRRRQAAIQKKLPDALDLMTISVDAGSSFDGAMSKVNEKWDDPLAQDFGRVVYEMQLGKTRRQALRDMSDRMDVPEVTSFVASVIQSDQLGVSIGRVLRIQSDQMRLRRRQMAEEKAQQASIKMLFPLIFMIFPSMFIVLLGPAIFLVMRSGALGAIG